MTATQETDSPDRPPTGDKVTENRVREWAKRQGFTLHKNRARRTDAPDYGKYGLKDTDGQWIMGLPGASYPFGSLDQVVDYLKGNMPDSIVRYWCSHIDDVITNGLEGECDRLEAMLDHLPAGAGQLGTAEGFLDPRDLGTCIDRLEQIYNALYPGAGREAWDGLKDDDPAVAHSLRFRKVSTLYPRMVAMAYDSDLAAAMADDDETVAAVVAAWERSQGMEPRDWAAWGRDTERDPAEDES